MRIQRKRGGIVATLVTFLVCLSGQLLVAQATNTGTVIGTVTDPSGAAIPNATITLLDVATKTARTTQSSTSGQYLLPNVPPGTYNVTVTSSGFETAQVNGQTVTVGTQTTVNVSLKIGNQSQTVEVVANGAQLQTMNATVGSVVDQVAIDSLPSILHDVGTFTELQPGVSPDGSVAGAVVDQSTFLLDGGNNSSDMDGSMSVYTGTFAGDPTGGAGGQSSEGELASGPTGVMPTPQDSVEEFKVNTVGQTADFNNSAGAQVEIVTRRGQDRFHGTGYEYYLDNNLNANTWSNNLSGTPQPSFHYSKFGVGVGGPMTPRFAGGKTYFFGFYQGWRYPSAETFSRAVPSPSLLAGILTDPSTGLTYNLKAIDPRGIGINPTVLSMWQKYEPAGNVPTCADFSSKTYCDTYNTVEYKANLALPIEDNNWVARIDHNFGERWQWMASYRYYKLTEATASQVDTGGFFSGDKLGVPASVFNKPQQPWYLVTGLTTSITARLTNDFHFSYLRNYWNWMGADAPAQVSGLGGALEPLGEGSGVSGVLAPFNLNTQSIRTRFWDGHDYFFRDDMTYAKGTHVLQWGGQFERNWDYHQRSDNGGGINYTTTYQLGDSSGAGLIDLSDLGGGFPTASLNVARMAAAAYGMVTDSQVAYTRSGSNLTLNPPLTHAFDQSTILFYNIYFSDTWRINPSVTLSYGLGWTLEMPPTEAEGKQDVLVDSSDKPISEADYIQQREAAALDGQVYNPQLGFALTHNVSGNPKYPYNPFYGSISPRVAVAWNPHFDPGTLAGKIFGTEDTVIRGGYGRQYGRLNGVDLVLSPLLGVGLIQAVQCRTALKNGTCGSSNPTASTAFRIGVDGDTAPLPSASQTLPQPVFPGYNSIASSASEATDPDFRPNVIDSFNLTLQRQVTHNTLVEVGYIGRIVNHEYLPINLNAVPYMMTVGGQKFSSAYANIERGLGCATSQGACGASVPASTSAAYSSYINSWAASNPQAFLESSLSSTYCKGTFPNGVAYTNCTAAVMDRELSNLTTQSVWSLWSDLDNGGFTFPATMMNTPISGSAYGSSGSSTSGVAMNASVGFGNYHAGFVSVKTSNWHGLTAQENFTYSKALGTGATVQATSEFTANDPFDLLKMYGVQAFQRKFVFNSFLVWQEPFFERQSGLGHILGGWQFGPILTAGSGEPLGCFTPTDAQSFGSGDGANYFDNEQCVFTKQYNGGAHSHYGVSGGTDPYGNNVGGSTASVAINMFKDPVSVWNSVRPPILGIDNKDSGAGTIYGMPYWNMDLSVSKNFLITEGIRFEYSMIFANVFNHTVLGDPSLSLSSPSSWGVESSNVNSPRSMEFGLRVRF